MADPYRLDCPFELRAVGPEEKLMLQFRCYYCDWVGLVPAHHPWCGWFPIRIFEVKPEERV